MTILTKEVLAAMRDIDPKKKFLDDPDWTTERALALLDEHERFKRTVEQGVKVLLDFAEFALRQINEVKGGTSC